MKKKVISLESNKYELKLDNFEGPLDLQILQTNIFNT